MSITSPGQDNRAPVVPKREDAKLLDWLMQRVKEADEYLQAQNGHGDIEKVKDMVSGKMSSMARSPKLSKTQTNRFRKIFFDMSAGLTDTRAFWEYKSFNEDLQQTAKLFNKLSEAWWEQNSIDQKWLGVIQYALSGSVGYAHLHYNQQTDDIDISPCDPRDVLPYRPSSLHSIQSCEAVFHREEKPVSYLLQRYPKKAHLIRKDKTIEAPRNQDVSTQYGRLMQGIGLTNFQKALFGEEPAKALGKMDVVNIYKAYIDDPAKNETGDRVEVGPFKEESIKSHGETVRVPAEEWSYVVKPGERLYPRKRLVVFTRTVILYDGPSPFWHGMYPFVKMTLDPLPWSWYGVSPMWPLIPLQESLNGLYRIMDDHAEQVARPAVIADKNSVPRSSLDRIDTRRAGIKVLHNPTIGKGVQIVPPTPLDPIIMQQIEDIKNEMAELAGTNDLSQLSQLNQIPQTETVEKIIEAMTPSIRLRSRVLEACVRELAYMLMSNFVQFYDLQRRVAILGQEGVTESDFDVDMGSLIPAFTDEEALDLQSFIEGPGQRVERSKEWLRKFHFQVAPSSLLNASAVSQKMLYIQLFRMGVMDPWTLYEKLGVPNVGKAPEDAKTITERLQVAQKYGFVGAVSSAGRKSSGQQMPTMRPDGIISESG